MRVELAVALALISGSAMAAPGADSPEPELLEFLGQWNADDGAWLDAALDDSQAESESAHAKEDQSND